MAGMHALQEQVHAIHETHGSRGTRAAPNSLWCHTKVVHVARMERTRNAGAVPCNKPWRQPPHCASLHAGYGLVTRSPRSTRASLPLGPLPRTVHFMDEMSERTRTYSQ